ncbi:MAG: type I restriction endonuclease subunit R, partial [Vulcanimicrobiota bacterium]
MVTAELKNELTTQRAALAKKQYKEDRDPKAPIFRWKERALVHFAVDADTAWFTTRLAKGSTRFFPFNRGDGFGAGNPAVKEKHRTHYLWENVWERHSLL